MIASAILILLAVVLTRNSHRRTHGLATTSWRSPEVLFRD
jgi:hypothetical protein